MDYQNYEDYMRSVLGYQAMQNNIYTDAYNYQDTYSNPNNNYYYEVPFQNTNMMNMREDELNDLYPEIYKIVYPMVCEVCNQNYNRQITRTLLDQMTEEIYSNVEPEDKQNTTFVRNQSLKNGDVRNPNAKEPVVPVKETRQTNSLLRDLIRILLLREWIRPGRPPARPPFPGGRPQPPRPGPGRPPMGPPPRPRYF